MHRTALASPRLAAPRLSMQVYGPAALYIGPLSHRRKADD